MRHVSSYLHNICKVHSGYEIVSACVTNSLLTNSRRAMKPLGFLIALFMVLPSAWSQSVQAIRIHPENPKYFLFRGKPLVLITASEHYGSVMNRPFDFEKYLDDAAEHKMTLTRTFLLFRELQGPRNPSSPCKPESPDFIAPYVRTG